MSGYKKNNNPFGLTASADEPGVEDASTEEIVAFLEKIANDQNAAPEDVDRAREMLRQIERSKSARASRLASAALKRMASRDALNARMGLSAPGTNRPYSVGRQQIFPVMTAAQARAAVAAKAKRGR